ncbi:MAG: tryptophan synthase subunit alpha [Firmicutes bacterium]|nr:tryptophan synthase subunit alpha [Bacillota bacterium]
MAGKKEIPSIDKVFLELKKEKRKALIPYLSAGFPDESKFVKIAVEIAEKGADMLEIGVPFSDPIADGPVSKKSSFEALKKGVTLDKVFKMAEAVLAKAAIPLIIMSYYNPLYAYGLEKFARKANRSKIKGVIIPDLPLEESSEFESFLKMEGIDIIKLCAPNTDESRAKQIAGKTRGFLYLVSVTGVTGSREKLPVTLRDSILKLKSMTDKPVCVGFGISKPEQAKEVAKYADGVIVGSAIIELILKNSRKPEAKAGEFIRELRAVL